MIGTKLDPNWVKALKTATSHTTTDKFGHSRPQCLCSSRDLVPQSFICPRHNVQIKLARTKGKRLKGE
jgi:hypothetical protein